MNHGKIDYNASSQPMANTHCKTMKTRSQTNAEILDVNIDFDEASRYWNANKKRAGNGSYVYVCGAQLKNGNFCKRSMQPCFMHRHDTAGL